MLWKPRIFRKFLVFCIILQCFRQCENDFPMCLVFRWIKYCQSVIVLTNSNIFIYSIQNQGKLGHIAAKTSVPRVSSSGAPRIWQSSYLGVKFNKELVFDTFGMILERLGAQHFKKANRSNLKTVTCDGLTDHCLNKVGSPNDQNSGRLYLFPKITQLHTAGFKQWPATHHRLPFLKLLWLVFWKNVS